MGGKVRSAYSEGFVGSTGNELSVVEDHFGSGLCGEIRVSHEVDFLGEDRFDCRANVFGGLPCCGDQLAVVNEGFLYGFKGEGLWEGGLGWFSFFGSRGRFRYRGRFRGGGRFSGGG